MKAKATVEERYLARKMPKHVSKILVECPDTGEVIEEFVSVANVGAVQWRITGILTCHTPQKCHLWLN